MTDHPITPSPELVQQWMAEPEHRNLGRVTLHTLSETRLTQIATRAAQWGADQELESCCSWVDWKCSGSTARLLREDRRPKPQSFKRVALLQLDTLNADLGLEGKGIDLSQIRRALEQLDD